LKIAIASGKGGTGKTFVAVNLFYAISHAGIQVSFVDCDAEEPNAAEFLKGKITSKTAAMLPIPFIDVSRCIFCGRCYEFCNYHAIVYLPYAGFIQVVEDLCHSCGACLVACGQGAITEIEKKTGEITSLEVYDHLKMIEGCVRVGQYSPVSVIKNALSALNGNDTISILDSPPGISCPFIATVEKADFTILVTEPTPFGLNDLKLSVETLRNLRKTFGVIVNRAGIGNREVYEWLRHNNIPLLLEIPFDKDIARINSEGRLIAELLPAYRNQFYRIFERIQDILKHTE
jgi:MinD superfamily P-loop ATPase